MKIRKAASNATKFAKYFNRRAYAIQLDERIWEIIKVAREYTIPNTYLSTTIKLACLSSKSNIEKYLNISEKRMISKSNPMNNIVIR